MDFYGRCRLKTFSLFFPASMALEIRTESRVTFFPFLLIPLIEGNSVWAIGVKLGKCVNWNKVKKEGENWLEELPVMRWR